MGSIYGLQSASAFSEAFRVPPELAEESIVGGDGEPSRAAGLGIYRWKTPAMESFELPESDELIVALHLGGSRRVRAITERGLSRNCSAPGLLTVLPPNRRVAFRTDGSISLVSLHISRATVEALRSEPLQRLAQSGAARFAFRDPFVSAALESLLRAARSRQRLHPDYLGAMTHALLCHLAQWHLGNSTDDALSASPMVKLGRISLGDLLTHIDRTLSSRQTLDDLARHVGLSRSNFTREFRASLGISPHQHIETRRIETAKRMLAHTDLDLSFIAQETGYSSQSHFSANFRSQTGVTPTGFRAAIAERQPSTRDE